MKDDLRASTLPFARIPCSPLSCHLGVSNVSYALVAAIRESGGYLEDEGWHQTGQLMSLAADEIERLNERIRVLEGRRGGARGSRIPRPVSGRAKSR